MRGFWWWFGLFVKKKKREGGAVLDRVTEETKQPNAVAKL